MSKPHSVAAIFGVFNKGTTWFTLQKNYPECNRICERWPWGADQRQGEQKDQIRKNNSLNQDKNYLEYQERRERGAEGGVYRSPFSCREWHAKERNEYMTSPRFQA